MTWRIATRHTSIYRYASPVAASYNEARMTPVTSPGQVVLETHLAVTPSTPLFAYVDYWSTAVHAFDVHQPHDELRVVANSLVETAAPRGIGLAPSWDDLADPDLKDRLSELLTTTSYAPLDDELGETARALAAGLAPADAVAAIEERVRTSMRYEPGTTEVSTSALDAWRQASGVCQDFAHVTLVLLRQLGIPARYTSGYLHPNPEAAEQTVRGASHAWVEAWLGEWVPIDPTNGEPVGERHVVVAHGRDYADVAPLLGVYHGGALESLEVTVELTRVG